MATASYFYEDYDEEDEVRYGLRYQEDLHQNEKGFRDGVSLDSGNLGRGGCVAHSGVGFFISSLLVGNLRVTVNSFTA